jgi:hypothetical protein
VLAWLLGRLPDDTLVGLDLGISLPFADCGAFFPGGRTAGGCKGAVGMVDAVCASDPHLAVGSFVDHSRRAAISVATADARVRGFHAADAADRRGRFRVTERAQAAMGCKPYSNFNLVGAAQVGKSSLSGMRVLHRLAGRLPVWPIDPLPRRGSAVVEIYTAIAALAAGRPADPQQDPQLR